MTLYPAPKSASGHNPRRDHARNVAAKDPAIRLAVAVNKIMQVLAGISVQRLLDLLVGDDAMAGFGADFLHHLQAPADGVIIKLRMPWRRSA
jgi:hypothetical protein